MKKASALTVKAAAPAAKVTTVPAPAPAPTPSVLSIVVVDEKGQPVSGARVTINPGSVSGATDASGQYQFPLGNYPKYDITAAYGSNSATVPYYVTRDGATRLVINPVYVNTVQQQRSSWSLSGIAKGAGIALAVAIVLVAAWKFIFSRPR